MYRLIVCYTKKMFDKFHNSDGSHGAELLTYIYGEMDECAREVFESHLERCDECAVELGAISDARLGVIEWRRGDFERLETPAMVVPGLYGDRTVSRSTEKAGAFAALIESLSTLSAYARAG